MKLRKKMLSALLAAAMVMAMTACSSSGTDSASSDSGDKADSSGAGYRIGFTTALMETRTVSKWKHMLQEAADELTETGEIAEFTIVAANNDASKQVQQIENFILG